MTRDATEPAAAAGDEIEAACSPAPAPHTVLMNIPPEQAAVPTAADLSSGEETIRPQDGRTGSAGVRGSAVVKRVGVATVSGGPNIERRQALPSARHNPRLVRGSVPALPGGVLPVPIRTAGPWRSRLVSLLVVAAALAVVATVVALPMRAGTATAQAGVTSSPSAEAASASAEAMSTELPPAGVEPVTSVDGQAVSLTVDDGPDPRYTPGLLDLLAALKIKAVFCVVGASARSHPDLVRRIADEGHELCNHSDDHDLALRDKTRAEIDQDLLAASEAIEDASGERPRYFRVPGGNWSVSVAEAARADGMIALGWNVDTNDWRKPGTAAVQASIVNAAPGSIILCHDGGGDRSQTMAALRLALPGLLDRHLQFVAP